MNALDVFQLMLLGLVVICGVSACLTKNLLVSLIIFMAYSVIMSVIWVLLEAPDLAVTEAAVGAGISSILLFLTLKKLQDIRKEVRDEKQEEDEGLCRRRRRPRTARACPSSTGSRRSSLPAFGRSIPGLPVCWGL